MGFHQQKPDHRLIITRLYINKTNTYLYCILHKLLQHDKDTYNQFSYRQLDVLKQK